MIFIFYIIGFLIFGINGVLQSSFYQSFQPNIFTFLYSLHDWCFTSYCGFSVNFFGVTLSFTFAPHTICISILYYYLIIITYINTCRGYLQTLFALLSTMLAFLHCFLVLHADFVPLLVVLSFLSMILFLCILYIFKKNTEYIKTLTKKLEETPHMGTKLCNVMKAYSNIPLPLSSKDRYMRFCYYDLIFGVMTVCGFLKTHIILLLIISRFFLSTSTMYLLISANLWILFTLAILVFDNKWSNNFKHHNGEDVLYLLGYNNIITNLRHTVFSAGIYGVITSLMYIMGMGDHANCVGSDNEEEARPKASVDSADKEASVTVKVGACEQIFRGSISALPQLGEEGNKALALMLKHKGCTYAPVGQRLADSAQKIGESWGVKPTANK